MMLRIATFVFFFLWTVNAGNSQQVSPDPARHESTRVKSETPEEVYEAFCKSLESGEYSAFVTRVTPNKAAYIIFELYFAAGMRDEERLNQYLDNDFILEAERKAGGHLNVEQRHAVITASIKDKPTFFRYLAAELSKRTKGEIAEPLRKVTIKGDRARGVVTRYVGSLRGEKDGTVTKRRTPYDVPIYFNRSEHTWLIDNPTREESVRWTPITGPVIGWYLYRLTSGP